MLIMNPGTKAMCDVSMKLRVGQNDRHFVPTLISFTRKIFYENKSKKIM